MNKNCYNQQNLCLYKSGCPQFNLNCGEQTVQSVYAYFTVKLPDSTVSSVSPFPLDVTSSYNYNNGNPYIVIDDTTWQQITSQVPKGVKLIAEIIVHDSDGCLLCSTNFLIDIVWFQHELVTATQDPESSPFLTCQNVDDCVELVDNNDGTYTFTAGDTPSVTFDTNETPLVANSSATIDFITSGTSDHIIDASVKISTAAGNDLSSDATGLFLDVQASETKTVISYDPVTHTISYTDEDNSITNLVLNNGSISYFPATNDLQYVSENGTTTTLSLNNIEITNTITGHKIADIKNELGLTVQVNETVTTVLNTVSGHKIADYTNENGDVVDINETVTTISYDPVTNTISYTDENNNTTDLAMQNIQHTSLNSATLITDASRVAIANVSPSADNLSGITEYRSSRSVNFVVRNGIVQANVVPAGIYMTNSTPPGTPLPFGTLTFVDANAVLYNTLNAGTTLIPLGIITPLSTRYVIISNFWNANAFTATSNGVVYIGRGINGLAGPISAGQTNSIPSGTAFPASSNSATPYGNRNSLTQMANYPVGTVLSTPIYQNVSAVYNQSGNTSVGIRAE